MMGGGPPGSAGMPGSSGPGLAAGQDPAKPFAAERNKKALEDLISAVQK